MIVAVLDTNVLVSGIIGSANAGSVPGALLRAWRRAAFTLATSDSILADELPRTLAKPYFRARIAPQDVVSLLALFRQYALVVVPTEGVAGVATHPEDDLVLATAVAADAAFLVTGDADLQRLSSYRSTRIVSPRSFLAILEQETPNQTT